MKRLLSVFTVLLLTTATSGCGFLFVKGPPAAVPNTANFQCTDSKTLPYLDVAMAGLQVLNILYVNSMDDYDFRDMFPDMEKSQVMGAQAGMGVLWAFSAKSGMGKVNDCIAARAAAGAQDRARAARAADLAQDWRPPMLLPSSPLPPERARPGGGAN